MRGAVTQFPLYAIMVWIGTALSFCAETRVPSCFWYSGLEYDELWASSCSIYWVCPGVSIGITESDRGYFQNWAVLVSLIEHNSVKTYAGLDGGEKPASRFGHFFPRKELLVPGYTYSSREKNLLGVESTHAVRNLITIFARLGYQTRTSPSRHLWHCWRIKICLRFIRSCAFFMTCVPTKF
jgi:hypothetical protein